MKNFSLLKEWRLITVNRIKFKPIKLSLISYKTTVPLLRLIQNGKSLKTNQSSGQTKVSKSNNSN